LGSPCNKDNRLVGSQTEAILYVFFDIPCFFSKFELENFLGVIPPNHNVGGALLKMLEAGMIIKTKNKIDTEQFYLGNFGMEALQRSTISDINNRPNNFLEFITLRTENVYQLINDRAARLIATKKRESPAKTERLKTTKKRDSPAKTSTKITPQQKRKKLKRTPAKDCAKDSSASSSSSYKASSSEDDDNEDEDTDKEPGNNTDDTDNDDNDNDNDNDDNDDNSDNGNDNDNDNDNDKDNNSGFMDQDLYDPKDDPEDGRIVTV
jgi:hypothetical protein